MILEIFERKVFEIFERRGLRADLWAKVFCRVVRMGPTRRALHDACIGYNIENEITSWRNYDWQLASAASGYN